MKVQRDQPVMGILHCARRALFELQGSGTFSINGQLRSGAGQNGGPSQDGWWIGDPAHLGIAHRNKKVRARFYYLTNAVGIGMTLTFGLCRGVGVYVDGLGTPVFNVPHDGSDNMIISSALGGTFTATPGANEYKEVGASAWTPLTEGQYVLGVNLPGAIPTNGAIEFGAILEWAYA